MNITALRLMPGMDFRKELSAHLAREQLSSAFVLTAVGSLQTAVLRLADESLKEYVGPFEIVSVVGTFSPDGVHLHISIADASGIVVGGHVKEGCIIHTTAEVVLASSDELVFSREFDARTGFKELQIQHKRKRI